MDVPTRSKIGRFLLRVFSRRFTASVSVSTPASTRTCPGSQSTFAVIAVSQSAWHSALASGAFSSPSHCGSSNATLHSPSHVPSQVPLHAPSHLPTISPVHSPWQVPEQVPPHLAVPST